MSAAATAAGYLYASGRISGPGKRKREAERAAEDLKRERDKKFFSDLSAAMNSGKPIFNMPARGRR